MLTIRQMWNRLIFPFTKMMLEIKIQRKILSGDIPHADTCPCPECYLIKTCPCDTCATKRASREISIVETDAWKEFLNEDITTGKDQK